MLNLSQTIEIIKDVYNLSGNEIIVEREGVYFTASFVYSGHKISVEINKDRMYEYYLDISVRKNASCEPTAFWQLFAYHENSPFNMCCDADNLTFYLAHLKYYVDNDKIFYEVYDIPNRKRYFYLDGVKREIDYIVDADFNTETTKLFGKNAARVINNRPVYVG